MRTGSAEVETAEEKITEALTQLEKIDAVKKIAGTIPRRPQRRGRALATAHRAEGDPAQDVRRRRGSDDNCTRPADLPSGV